MRLFKKKSDLQNYLSRFRNHSGTIGFAPTMGALHPGHLSLINNSKPENALTVSSIFVNPTQFNVSSDFQKYPVTIDQDIQALETAGCDVLFLPSVTEMYPEGTAPTTHYDLGFLETVLEGKYRPGHFQGVCQVVDKLLDIVSPDNLYMGQKDYQQCMIIDRLLEIKGIKQKCKLHVCPTLREADGLAMSSRNMRLTEEDRSKAPAIYQWLKFVKDNITPGEITDLKKKATANLENEGFRVDYVEIADARTLEPVDRWDGKKPLVVLAAAFLNDVRLIDNLIL